MSDDEQNDNLSDLNSAARKITTRRNSKAQQEYDTQANQLKIKHKYYCDKVKQIKAKFDDETTFNAWSIGELDARLSKIEYNEANILKIYEKRLFNYNENNDVTDDDEIEDIIQQLKAKINDRKRVLENKNTSQAIVPKDNNLLLKCNKRMPLEMCPTHGAHLTETIPNGSLSATDGWQQCTTTKKSQQ